MNEFLAALAEHGFLQQALVAGLLASLGCGLIGPFVVVKRITFLAGGIAHSVLAGMGAALYYGHDPLAGALVAAVPRPAMSMPRRSGSASSASMRPTMRPS